MKFRTNEKGGWIIPSGSNITESIPNYSQIGNGCKIGNYCEIGNYCTFDDSCTFDESCTFGSWCTFEDSCTFGDECTFGYKCTFDDSCTFDESCTLGNYCTFGDGCTFGYGCTFDDSCTIGNHCEIASIKIVKLMTLSNVDGSGRQIKLIFDGEKIHVEAGCFFGNVNDFCEKAESEGKYFYSKMIRTNALVMLDYYGSTTTDC